MNRPYILYQMSDELMTGQPQCQGLCRSTPDGTAEAIDIEPKRGVHVMNRKGEMKQSLAH